MRNEKQIEFTLTIDDIKTMNRFYLRHRTTMLRNNLIGIAALAGATVFFVTRYLRYGVTPGLTFGGPAIAVVALLFVAAQLEFKWRNWRRYKTLPQADPDLFSPWLLRITPENLYQRNGAGESNLRWGALADISEAEGAIYFFLPKQGKGGPVGGVYIAPRHAFASDADMNAFATLARGYLDEARQNATAKPAPAAR